MTIVGIMLVSSLVAVGALGWLISMHPPATPSAIVSIAANAFAAGLAAGVLLWGRATR